MATASDFPAVGRVMGVSDDAVVFLPLNTNYELKLQTSEKYPGPVGERIEARIRVRARKLLTVTSGGNFIAPIFGPPRIIQGRIKYLDEREMVIQAGAPILVELPMSDQAYDMERGPLAIGQLVNVTALPDAKIEWVGQVASV